MVFLIDFEYRLDISLTFQVLHRQGQPNIVLGDTLPPAFLSDDKFPLNSQRSEVKRHKIIMGTTTSTSEINLNSPGE
jgi:hypothetical protein